LSDLSNIQQNTSSQITALNGNIDKIMSLRQQDREATRQNLLDRLDLIKNNVSPTELELLKTKMNQKLDSINKSERAQAEIVKAKTNDLLTN
jgi:hypothetical protein